MKALVTGAAGFIGSNLVHHLVETRRGVDVVALDSLSYAGNLANLEPLLGEKAITFEKADITDAGVIDALFAKHRFDLVYHLAAESHVDRSIHSAMEFVRTNVLGTQVLLDAAKGSAVSTFVHVSTDEVYGSLGDTGRFHETTPLDPTSPYSASKAASDLMALAFQKTHGLPVMVTRCTNNYGPYQFPEKLIPLFITNALEGKKLPLYGDGMNVRSWLYVRDHCEALVRVAEKGRTGEVYNIGGTPECEQPNKVVTQKILSILGKPESLIERVGDRPAHDRRYAVDIEKVRSELGWTPSVSFEEGLQKTVQWYVQNESWWRGIKSGEYLRYYDRNYGKR
jgi:dTDP-glucose 4,6-dehydratase